MKAVAERNPYEPPGSEIADPDQYSEVVRLTPLFWISLAIGVAVAGFVAGFAVVAIFNPLGLI